MRDVDYIDSHFIAGSDYRQITRRDYVGAFEFAADTLERTLLPEGFVTAADNALHIFIPDYQGNITGVYNSSANALVQFTDYYPYGLPHASATSTEVNSRKYGAKELTTDHGLNLYDFAARWQNPAFPHFTTPDPLAEKDFSISPFTYCGGDPINLIDPTGEFLLKNINPNTEYGIIYIIPVPKKKTNPYEKDAIDFTYNALNECNLPYIQVEGIEDFAEALKSLDQMMSGTSIYMISGHGNSGKFHIGNEIVDINTDYSILKDWIAGSKIIIYSCLTAVGEKGTALLKKMAEQMSCVIIGACHKMKAGAEISELPNFGDILYSFNRTIGCDYENSYKIALDKSTVYTIYNVYTAGDEIKYDQGNKDYKENFFNSIISKINFILYKW